VVQEHQVFWHPDRGPLGDRDLEPRVPLGTRRPRSGTSAGARSTTPLRTRRSPSRRAARPDPAGPGSGRSSPARARVRVEMDREAELFADRPDRVVARVVIGRPSTPLHGKISPPSPCCFAHRISATAAATSRRSARKPGPCAARAPSIRTPPSSGCARDSPPTAARARRPRPASRSRRRTAASSFR